MIDLLLVFGLLVVVPLGLLQVHRTTVPIPWPVAGAALLVAAASLLIEPGAVAAALAAPWLAVCLGLAVRALAGLVSRRSISLGRFVPAAALCYLCVGAGWLVVSRLGLRPLGFSDVIVELTAAHFHFAGFAAPLVAAATSAALEGRSRHLVRFALAARLGGMGVLAAMPLVAAGFVVSSRFGAVGAVLLAASLMTVAVAMVVEGTVRRGAAGALLGLAAASVTGAMVMAVGYALGPLPGLPSLSVARMAELHGTANAVGFCGAGLLGHVLTAEPAQLAGAGSDSRGGRDGAG